MKLKMRPTTTFEGTIDSMSIREVINFRIWWKPWTWLRRKVYLPYNPLMPQIDEWGSDDAT